VRKLGRLGQIKAKALRRRLAAAPGVAGADMAEIAAQIASLTRLPGLYYQLKQ
jgi:hypothetical protein